MKPDYYKILGVGRSADPADIKRAYRTRAKQCHPDLNPKPGATEEFMGVNEAYEILSDPRKKQVYDLSLRVVVTTGMPQQGQAREDQYKQWVAQAQHRSQQYARMNYQEFKRSRFEDAELQVFTYLQFLVIAVFWIIGLMLLIVPFAFFFIVDWKGIFFAVLTVPAAFKVFSFGWEAWKELKKHI